MNEEQRLVEAFHKKFKFTANPVNEVPTPIPQYLAKRRLQFMREEIRELRDATEARDIIAIADALADILYFTYGTAVAYGIDMTPIFAEVHRSNMTKSPTLGKDGKATKGPGYEFPKIARLLLEQGKPQETTGICRNCGAQIKRVKVSLPPGRWGHIRDDKTGGTFWESSEGCQVAEPIPQDPDCIDPGCAGQAAGECGPCKVETRRRRAA